MKNKGLIYGIIGVLLLLVSCLDDENAQPINLSPVIDQEELIAVFSPFTLEDRTEGGEEAALSITNIDNGAVQMLRDSISENFFLDFSGFNNINAPIDRDNPNIIASRFAVFLAISGASLETQNGFEEGDQPIYIGNIEMNGDLQLPLIPAENNGGAINIGGITLNTRSSTIMQTSTGTIVNQRSAGTQNQWYDWVILHPFQGDNLRPITYPGIVANLDANRLLPQNFLPVFNTAVLEDRTEDGTTPEVSITGIDNGTVAGVSYDNQTFIRLSNFMNINQLVDGSTVEASQFAVFLTTTAEALETQSAFEATGSRPVYIGNITENGFIDLPFTPDSTNTMGVVMLGDTAVAINTNPDISLDVNGFVNFQNSATVTGGYDWIVLQPFEGENLRDSSTPGIVANIVSMVEEE